MTAAAAPRTSSSGASWRMSLDVSAVHACIIGAGVAGLQAARALLQRGIKVTILEKEGQVGGTWLTCGPHAQLQCVFYRQHPECYLGPWTQYSFPDLSWPPHLCPLHSTASSTEVLAYVQYYAEHYKLLQHVRFYSRLQQVLPSHQTGSRVSRWRVVFQDTQTRKHMELHVSHVVLATGLHSNVYIPNYVGQAGFMGEKLHSRHVPVGHSFAGKDVVVVGASCSVWDTLAECSIAQQARSVALLYRKVLWPLPADTTNDCPCISSPTITALSDVPYYTEPETGCLSPSGPIQRLQARTAARKLQRMFGIKQGGVSPQQPLHSSLVRGVQVVMDPNQWAACARHPHARMLRGRMRCFMAEGIVLDSGEEIAADCVVYCTGFTQKHPWLEQQLTQTLGIQDDGLYLYRSVVHPDVNNLAFIGCMADTTNTLIASGLQSQWLAQLITQEIRLPSRQYMHADIRAQQAWRRQHMPPAQDRASVYGVYTHHYFQQLSVDMHVSIPKEIHCLPIPFHKVTHDSYLSYFPASAVAVADRRTSIPSSPGGTRPGSLWGAQELDEAGLQRLHLANESNTSGISSLLHRLDTPASMAVSTVPGRASAAQSQAGTPQQGTFTPQATFTTQGTFTPMTAPRSPLSQSRIIKNEHSASRMLSGPNDQSKTGSSPKPTALSLALKAMKRLSRPWTRTKSTEDPVMLHTEGGDWQHGSFIQLGAESGQCLEDDFHLSSQSFTAGVTPTGHVRAHPKSRLSRPGTCASPPASGSGTDYHAPPSPRTTSSSATALTLARQATLTAGLLAHHATDATLTPLSAQAPTSPPQQHPPHNPVSASLFPSPFTSPFQQGAHHSTNPTSTSQQQQFQATRGSTSQAGHTPQPAHIGSGHIPPLTALQPAQHDTLMQPSHAAACSAEGMHVNRGSHATSVRKVGPGDGTEQGLANPTGHSQSTSQGTLQGTEAEALHSQNGGAVAPVHHAHEQHHAGGQQHTGQQHHAAQLAGVQHVSVQHSKHDSHMEIVAASDGSVSMMPPNAVLMLIGEDGEQETPTETAEAEFECEGPVTSQQPNWGAAGIIEGQQVVTEPQMGPGRSKFMSAESNLIFGYTTCPLSPVRPTGYSFEGVAGSSSLMTMDRSSSNEFRSMPLARGPINSAAGSPPSSGCLTTFRAPTSRLRATTQGGMISESGVEAAPPSSTRVTGKSGVRWAEDEIKVERESDETNRRSRHTYKDDEEATRKSRGSRTSNSSAFQRSKSTGFELPVVEAGNNRVGALLAPARERLQARKSGRAASEELSRQSTHMKTLDKFQDILSMAVDPHGSHGSHGLLDHTLSTCPDEILLRRKTACSSLSGALLNGRTVSGAGMDSPPGSSTSVTERTGSASVLQKLLQPKQAVRGKGAVALGLAERRGSHTSKPTLAMQLDATAQGLLEVSEKAHDAQPQSYVEKSYASLLRDMAMGFEPTS